MSIEPKRILFVCVHNAGRSQMAEAFANAEARERGLAIVAASAGTIGGDRVNPIAVEVMQELGIAMDGHRPKLLTPEAAAAADRVVTMGCGVDADACPARLHISEDWGLNDPAGRPIEEVRAIRDQIRARVGRMLDELAGA